MGFPDKLNRSIDRYDSLLCVGLDPDIDKLPSPMKPTPDAVAEFNIAIIQATIGLAAAYKPNFGFYGALGASGWDVLCRTLAAIPASVPVILDAKVGDIGNTAEQYARMFFDQLGADALTVNPYMGADAVSPFTARQDRGVYLLCLTSNPGAADLQQRRTGDLTLFEHVAVRAREWNTCGNMGLVVGATQPESLGRIRSLAPELPFLIPGVGAQGGDLQAAVTGSRDSNGRGLLINASRAVQYASNGADYAEAARHAAQSLKDQINRYR